MTKILIPHGTTPTGFGIRQRSNGTLRATSPCCGRTMLGSKASCKGCDLSYEAWTSPITPLAEDVGLSMETSKNERVRKWVGRVIGYDDDEIVMSVLW